MSRIQCPNALFVDWLLILQIVKKIMQWKVYHTWNDRMSKKAYPEHYHDMIYLGLWSLVMRKMGGALINTTTVVTIRFQRTVFYPMPLIFSVLLLF